MLNLVACQAVVFARLGSTSSAYTVFEYHSCLHCAQSRTHLTRSAASKQQLLSIAKQHTRLVHVYVMPFISSWLAQGLPVKLATSAADTAVVLLLRTCCDIHKRRLYTAAVPLKGTLLFCAVSDEEHGGVYGTKFLLEDSVLRDTFAADYTLSELGGATLPDR
jgi:hypothetical protein